MFVLSEMNNFRIFGLLASFAVVVAFLADVLVAPAMLSVIERTRRPVGSTEALRRGPATG